jgi:uncharacterized protein (DUF2164 family)
VTINLPQETRAQSIHSIQRYFIERTDEEIGDLQATLLLDFFLAEIAPVVYNAAIADAQTHLRDQIADLEGVCYVPEFGYWD